MVFAADFEALAMTITPKGAVRRELLFGYQLGITADAAGLKRGNLDVAASCDRTRRILMLERVERGANHVVGVRRTDRLGHHVLDAHRLEHRAHRAAGDDAGTR